MMSYYLNCIKNYATFSGRARRKEFWMFFLFNLIFTFVISFIGNLINFTYLSTIYSIFIFLPSLAVAVRRLHDIGKSGWWILWLRIIEVVGFTVGFLFVLAGMFMAVLGLQGEFNTIGNITATGTGLVVGVLGLVIAGVALIIELVFMLTNGDKGENEYGLDPKEEADL